MSRERFEEAVEQFAFLGATRWGREAGRVGTGCVDSGDLPPLP